jgi:hypothetical protein
MKIHLFGYYIYTSYIPCNHLHHEDFVGGEKNPSVRNWICLELIMKWPTYLIGFWDYLCPHLLLYLGVFLGSRPRSELIPNMEVSLLVESMNTLWNFLSCITEMDCNSFLLKESSSISRSMSARSYSSICIIKSPSNPGTLPMSSKSRE